MAIERVPLQRNADLRGLFEKCFEKPVLFLAKQEWFVIFAVRF